MLNEGFRYRDLEAGVFITRDPLGFVDGPNVYTYVVQNPWTKFDPHGLREDTPNKDKLVPKKKPDAPSKAPVQKPQAQPKTGAKNTSRGSVASAVAPIVKGVATHGLADNYAQSRLDQLQKSGVITPQQRNQLEALIASRSARGGASAVKRQIPEIEKIINKHLATSLLQSANPTPNESQRMDQVQRAFVADAGVFADRPGAPGAREQADVLLSDPKNAVFIPQSIRDEIHGSPSELSRLNNSNAFVKVVPDPVNPSAAEIAAANPGMVSKNFDQNDIALMQTGKNSGLPVVTSNKAIVRQVQSQSERKAHFGGVRVITLGGSP